MKPIFDKVLVQLTEREKNKSLIYIPEEDGYKTGVVVDFGSYAGYVRDNKYHDFEKGQKVLFAAGAGREIDISGKKYVLLKATDIDCVE